MSNLKKEIILKFNNTLSSLLTELSPFIGSNYKFKFNKIIKINSNLPIKYFLTNGLIYKEKIFNKDASYFYENSKNSDITKEYNMIDEIFRLKNVYDNVNNKSKDNLWTYLQVLTLLAEDYKNKNIYSSFAFAN